MFNFAGSANRRTAPLHTSGKTHNQSEQQRCSDWLFSCWNNQHKYWCHSRSHSSHTRLTRDPWQQWASAAFVLWTTSSITDPCAKQIRSPSELWVWLCPARIGPNGLLVRILRRSGNTHQGQMKSICYTIRITYDVMSVVENLWEFWNDHALCML